MRKRQLSLVERWEMDVESYKRGVKVKVSEPQCFSCKNHIKGDAFHCKMYQQEEMPNYVMFPSKECPCYVNVSRLDITILTEEENRFFGGLYGACVGDILGVPVEFSTRQERDADPVREMRAYGTYHQPFGTWSDDTSLTLCLIDAMTQRFSLDTLAKNCIAFYKNAQFTPHGEVFDIGNATRVAIEKMASGILPMECGGKNENDNGNGSLMRVLPIAYYGMQSEENELISLIEEVSSLTHAHRRSKFACIFYVVYAMQLMKKADKVGAYEKTVDFMMKKCSQNYESEFVVFDKVLNKKCIYEEREKINSSGYVVDTLEASLWSFFHATSYKETVLNAVNLGGDTDTIAAIAGGLAGIYYGFQSIPDSWIQSIVKKTEIQKLFSLFYKKCYI
ncbi:MAG: ADP-ribosylglycohydrolase family protein [Lachnospiraceae bacterium]|nr:ADP-ribosylglycohydrolase family protein [Lachnospiraceae bacterium]